MASSSALWRIVPLLAFGGAAVVVTAILVAPGRLEDMLVLGIQGHAAPGERMTGTVDGADAQRTALPITLTQVATGLPQATDLQPVPGHDHYVAVLQKPGQASLLAIEAGSARPWFELNVHTRSEMGLLGIAFAPDFETSGVFYVHHSPPSGDKGVIHRWTTDPKTLKDPQQGPLILEVQQPYANHDGGQIRFGPDGYLYVGLGDGGSGFDPQGNGQNGRTLLGSILRISPKPEGGYAIPADNPFVGQESVHDAIFAYGLRNPWKFDFDAQGRLVAGDVGQNEIEEVDLVPPGGNLGWANMEARSCLKEPCEGFVDPIWQYDHSQGRSVTGGVVARSSGVEGLDGRFVLGDYGSGRLWALELPDRPGERAPEPLALGRFPISPTTFGTDARGRIYVNDFRGGGIYQLTPPQEPPEDDATPAR